MPGVAVGLGVALGVSSGPPNVRFSADGEAAPPAVVACDGVADTAADAARGAEA